MGDKEYKFWAALGEWWRSDTGGRTPNSEFGNLVDSSVELGSKIITPDSPIFTDANSSEGLFLIAFCFLVIAVFRGGKMLLGLDWYHFVLVVGILCAAAVFVSNLWYQYVQPFLSCLL